MGGWGSGPGLIWFRALKAAVSGSRADNSDRSTRLHDHRGLCGGAGASRQQRRRRHRWSDGLQDNLYRGGGLYGGKEACADAPSPSRSCCRDLHSDCCWSLGDGANETFFDFTEKYVYNEILVALMFAV